MRRVAVAMSTTGPEPKQGHRITELAAVEMNGGTTGETLHLRIMQGAASEPGKTGVTYSEALTRWTQFVAGSPLIVHDYYEFKRFLRAECQRESMGFDIARDYPVVDTWLLAKERFPRQRHGLTTVMRKLGIEANLAAWDALEAAKMVARVASKLSSMKAAEPALRTAVKVIAVAVAAPAAKAERPASELPIATAPQVPRELGVWVGRLWRALTGRA